jgi:hypothetical protein
MKLDRLTCHRDESNDLSERDFGAASEIGARLSILIAILSPTKFLDAELMVWTGWSRSVSAIGAKFVTR